jgi:hypothetical protein
VCVCLNSGLAKQELYNLSHSTSPHVFKGGTLNTFAPQLVHLYCSLVINSLYNRSAGTHNSYSRVEHGGSCL